MRRVREGGGRIGYLHGFTIDGDGNLWTTDVNDKTTVLGMAAKNADGVQTGQEALKISPTTGEVPMTLGKGGRDGRWPRHIRPSAGRCRSTQCARGGRFTLSLFTKLHSDNI